MTDSIADRVRGLLASDVYTQKGRMRADDLLVRERVGAALGEAAATARDLISRWRAERVPPSTREQPFPPAEVMEPVRAGERLVRAIEETSSAVRGLPVLNQDKVWDRVRGAGLDELMQFDWTLVGEAVALVTDLAGVSGLDEIDAAAVEARLRTIREVVSQLSRRTMATPCGGSSSRPLTVAPASRSTPAVARGTETGSAPWLITNS